MDLSTVVVDAYDPFHQRALRMAAPGRRKYFAISPTTYYEVILLVVAVRLLSQNL